MLGVLPFFVTVLNCAFRPASRITMHAVAPRDCESDVLEAGAVQLACFALPTCFAIFLRNVRPFGVAISVPALNPPDLSVVTTFGATTFAAPDAPRFFEEPNLRPSSFSLTFTPGTDFPIFLRVPLFRTIRTLVKRLPFDLSVFDPRPTRFFPIRTSTRQLRSAGLSSRQPIVTALLTSRSGLSTIAVSGFFAFVIVNLSGLVTGALWPSLTEIVAV